MSPADPACTPTPVPVSELAGLARGLEDSGVYNGAKLLRARRPRAGARGVPGGTQGR